MVELRRTSTADGNALRALLGTPEVGAWWGPVPDGFPMQDDPDATRWSILLDGRIAGMIQFGEEPEPDYRHAWIDIFVAPSLHSRGIGSDALRTLSRHLVAALGHHRITIDPAADNAAAIRCYEKAGFGRVGVMRAAWRDPASLRWRDVLLMELVVLPSEDEPGR